MKVRAKSKNIDWLTESLRNIGYSEQSQFDVMPSQIYEVHAIALWSGIVGYQIVGDSNFVSWMPSNIFDVVDCSMPPDWLANSLDDEVPFIVGPDFVVQDKEAYAEMVELVPEKVAQFRQRLAHRKAED